jgi:hypothetical protein
MYISAVGYTLPRSLHSVAGAPRSGAAEKTGHFGRDDREPKSGPPRGLRQGERKASTKARKEHSQERLRHLATMVGWVESVKAVAEPPHSKERAAGPQTNQRRPPQTAAATKAREEHSQE